MYYENVTRSSPKRAVRRALGALLALPALALVTPSIPLAQAEMPTLPQVNLDTAWAPPAGGTTRTVCASGCQYTSLQAAIDASARGDVISVRAGETFNGPFVLKNKGSGSGWIYIQSSAVDQLPPPGTRVSPSDAANMPRLQLSGADAGVRVVRTESNASFYRLVGLEITQTGYLTSTVEFGSSGLAPANAPGDIVIDRCYIHGSGSGSRSGRRGITLGSKRTSIVDSYISDYWETNADSQGIVGWYGAGPYKIENNYISAGAENIMFGGASPQFAVTPSDIVIRRNHLHKPLHWLPSSPDYDGTARELKNNLEFKNAQRVLVEGNILENNDADAQQGRIILITPKTSGACESFTKGSDITIRHNRLVNSPEGIMVNGRDGDRGFVPQPCDYTDMLRSERIHIHDNLFEEVNSKHLLLVQAGADSVIFDHNTGFSPGYNNVYLISNPNSQNGSSPKLTDFVFRNNIIDRAVKCDDGDAGTSGLNQCATNWTFVKNALVGSSSSQYPADNFFPSTIGDVGFVDHANGDYHLGAGSPYKNAGTDGRDLGADIDALDNLTSGVRSGTSGPPQTGSSTVQGVRRTDTRD